MRIATLIMLVSLGTLLFGASPLPMTHLGAQHEAHGANGVSVREIKGSLRPELIPDHVSYTMYFRSIAKTTSAGDTELRRRRAFAKAPGLSERETDDALTAADEFARRVERLDKEAKQLKDVNWPHPSTAVMAQLGSLQMQKEAIASEVWESLCVKLGSDSAQKARDHSRRIRSHITFVEGRIVP